MKTENNMIHTLKKMIKWNPEQKKSNLNQLHLLHRSILEWFVEAGTPTLTARRAARQKHPAVTVKKINLSNGNAAKSECNKTSEIV